MIKIMIIIIITIIFTVSTAKELRRTIQPSNYATIKP